MSWSVEGLVTVTGEGQ